MRAAIEIAVRAREWTASSSTVPNVTAMKVVNVDGKLNPDGLPTTAIKSREGRGRWAISFVASAPDCSMAIATMVKTAPFQPASHQARPTASDHDELFVGREGHARHVVCPGRPRGERLD